MFKKLDIVKFDSGTTYMVGDDRGDGFIGVIGWKNGKPFGANRVIDGARCTLIGYATRPATRADQWKFTPAN